jgi:hypothetical protein
MSKAKTKKQLKVHPGSLTSCAICGERVYGSDDYRWMKHRGFAHTICYQAMTGEKDAIIKKTNTTLERIPRVAYAPPTQTPNAPFAPAKTPAINAWLKFVEGMEKHINSKLKYDAYNVAAGYSKHFIVDSILKYAYELKYDLEMGNTDMDEATIRSIAHFASMLLFQPER